MRILNFNHFGSNVGGVEGYIAEVVAALQQAGHQSRLIYFSPGDNDQIFLDTTFAPLPEWPHSPAQAVSILEQVIAEFRPHVAYIHAIYHPTLVKWIAQHLPTVAYVHGPYPVCPGSAQYLRNQARVCPRTAGLMCMISAQVERCCWGSNPLLHLRLLNRVKAFTEAYEHVKTIFVGGQFMQQLLQRGRIAYDKLSILSPVLIQDPLPMFTFSETSKTILFAGRLVPEKGLRQLIQALTKLDIPWKLIVAGDGPEREPCQALAMELKVVDRVHFKGWVNKSAMATYLQTCAVVALPSLWPEPFGRLGPEAFLYGRPVVAFAVGGVSDWLEDGVSGYLVTPGNIEDFGHALYSLLTHPSLRLKMSEQARSKALSTWNASVHVERLLSAFEDARHAM